jgi:hypothetical protein
MNELAAAYRAALGSVERPKIFIIGRLFLRCRSAAVRWLARGCHTNAVNRPRQRRYDQIMRTRPLRRSALPLLFAAAATLLAPPARAADAPSTIGALLTAVTDAAPANAAEMHALQNKLQSNWAGKTVKIDAGKIIQVVTEGGGVKLISFPPDETVGNFIVKRALSHATLTEDQEAEGKKLSPGNDSYVVEGKVASVSAQFNGESDNGKAVVRLNLTLKDAKIVSTTIAPKKKKASATQPAQEKNAAPAAQ